MSIKKLSNNRSLISRAKTAFPTDDVQKAAYVVVTDSKTKKVNLVVFPSDVRVGDKSNPRLQSNVDVAGSLSTVGDISCESDMTVTGDITVTGKIISTGGELSVKDDGYVNFGDTDGEDGRGIRDNSGKIEFKVTGGEWTEMGSSSGTVTSVGLSDGDLIDTTGTNPITKSGTITINVDLSELTDGTAAIDGATDEMVYLDAGSQKRKQIDEIDLGQFNNDQAWTSNAGTVTSVGITDGNLIDSSGGPITSAGNITLAVDLSELSTSVSNTDGDFFVVVSSANAQKKLTKANINLSGFNNDTGFTTGGALDSRYIVKETALVDGDETLVTATFPAAAITNTDVVSSYSEGAFTIASTGDYRVSVHIALITAQNSRNNVYLNTKFTNGGSTYEEYTSAKDNIDNETSVLFEIPTAYFTFTDDTTRTVEIIVNADVGTEGDNIGTSDKFGNPSGMIEITKLS